MAKNDRKTGGYPRKEIPIQVGKTPDEAARNYAAMLTGSEIAAFRVIQGAEAKTGLMDRADVPTLLAYLREQAGRVQGGDLADAAAMLMNQATALQSLFARLAERGMSCETVSSFEASMRIALRAQSQCRAALETLAVIKNPPTIFARQANVTTGPQQVNNSIPSRTRETEIEQSKLLEAQYGERLDGGTEGAAIGDDPAMATLGKLEGAENAERKGSG